MSDVERRFSGHRYINLETFRRSGEGVETPLWFVEEGGYLYAETLSTTGKAKRLRREPRVRVVPCDRRGEPRGDWVEGKAEFVGGKEAARAHWRLDCKYGLQRRLVDLMYLFSRGDRVVLRILVEAGGSTGTSG